METKLPKLFFKIEIRSLETFLLLCMRQLHVFSIEASYQFLNMLLYIMNAKGNNAVIIKGMLQGLMG